MDNMLHAAVSEPTQSPWTSPVVLDLKADRTPRFCVNYRRLNAVTIRDTFPIPRMEAYFDSLGDAIVFTALEYNWGYWQVPVRQKYREETAFTCHAGIYRFKRMPFGLTNA